MTTIQMNRRVALTLVLLLNMLVFTAPLAAAPATLLQEFSPTQNVIPACAPITTNTTWSTDNIYVIENCNLVVQAGATLTLQPGVVIKFGGVSPGYGSGPGSAAMIVQGSLVAVGAQAQPVVFTSSKDDAHGGDTNGNGASTGAAGDWYGIVFQPGSTGQLNHFFVGYGGSGAFNATVGYGRAQIDINRAAVQLRQGVITTGLRKGIYLDGANITPLIENVQIANNIGAGGYGDRGDAIYQASINMQPTFSGNSFSGNSFNQVTIDVNTAMTRSVTLGGAHFGFVCGYTLCLLAVPNGAALTVAPNTLLDFGPPYGISINDGGALIAQGTASQPITFTSQLAAAGNPDQHWIGLWAKQGSTLRLDHCDISYADDGNFGNGGLELDADNAQVSNCRIHHNKRTGLYLASLSNSTVRPVLTNLDVTDNGQTGVHFDARYASVLSVTWDGGNISRNGWSGVSSYTSNSILNPTLRNLVIADNGANGDFAERRAGIYWNHHNINPTLENLTITGNVGAALFWYCNGSITARNVTATDNGLNALVLPGCSVSGGRQWDLGDASIPTRVTGSIDIAANGLLSIQPGTSLRFDRRADGGSYGLYVPDRASLYALGTAAKPIRFVGTSAEMNWWNGIEVRDRATLVLHHCEIAYGGKNTANDLLASLVVRWGLSGSAPTADVQNCEIHHSGRKGVHFDFANFANTPPPVFRYNNLHDNTEEAVANVNAPPLDARDNYWGDPTGPFHAKQNPGGLGDNVGDNILFYPWLTAPPTGEELPGAMLVSTGAPSQISPGESVDYALQALNQMTRTVHGAILMLQLPQAASFVEGTQGAIYWPDRHQVFWKLGDLASGANKFVSVRVRFQWGLAADYSDGSFTQFAGTDYNAAALDVAEYSAYQSSLLRVTAIVNLSAAEFDAVRATSAGLESLYQSALGDGFLYMSAARVTYHDGKIVVNAAMRTADRQFGRILSLNSDGQVLSSTVSGGGTSVQDMGGGLRAELATQTYTLSGGWLAGGIQVAASPCDAEICFRNCMLKAKAWGAVTRKVAGALSWVIPPVGAVWTTYEVYDEITTYLLCKEQCPVNDPSQHCCTPGETRWSPTGLKQQCAQYSCDALGTWQETPDKIDKCAFGQRCMAGGGAEGGCKACEEDLLAARFTPVSVRPGIAGANCAANATPHCSNLTVRQAKDPNAIYGPAGDLLPGATAVYTITYENEGAGRAYGVYVVNPLPAVFDAATLNLHGKGEYLPGSREIAWLVGELGPKGALDSEGAVAYTVALTGGLPSGTVVANQATVFFPSVPEETPTNTWVNLVAPLAAIPQNATTAYQTPLPITLGGREVSGLPLTYAIVAPPINGTLSGSAPNMTYAPGENFTGPDSFSFQVSNGVATSRAAQVSIEVTPTGDATPPQVLWSNPAASSTGVAASPTPVFTDAAGPVYAPVILIGVSESLDETTVSATTVMLARSGGAGIAASAVFDGAFNQVVVQPRAALAEGEYVVTMTTVIADRAGNRLVAPYTTSFTIGAPVKDQRVLLPLIQR